MGLILLQDSSDAALNSGTVITALRNVFGRSTGAHVRVPDADDPVGNSCANGLMIAWRETEMWRALTAWLNPPPQSATVGTITDLASHIQRLIDAPEGSWLRVDLIDQKDAFLQFTAAPDRIQIDHPLVTPPQIEREDALRTTLSTLGVTPYETRGSDGSRFLNCDAPRGVINP